MTCEQSQEYKKIQNCNKDIFVFSFSFSKEKETSASLSLLFKRGKHHDFKVKCLNVHPDFHKCLRHLDIILYPALMYLYMTLLNWSTRRWRFRWGLTPLSTQWFSKDSSCGCTLSGISRWDRTYKKIQWSLLFIESNISLTWPKKRMNEEAKENKTKNLEEDCFSLLPPHLPYILWECLY